MMDIFEWLEARWRDAIQSLQRLVGSAQASAPKRAKTTEEHWQTVENVLQEAGRIFDEIRSCLQIEDNLIWKRLHLHHLDDHPRWLARKLQEEIERLMETSTMMHVDEPSHQFRNNLQALLAVSIRYNNLIQTELFPLAKSVLSPEDLQEISRKIPAQTQQERYPTSIPINMSWM